MISLPGQDSLEDFFRPGGLLSRKHSGYDHRPQQEKMARAVAGAIDDKAILMVEAGTGVGKSLAYLYPFLTWARRTRGRVAVSTETKTLQRQLLEKDLPFLNREAGVSVRAELCLGAGNYLCRYRLDGSSREGLLDGKEIKRQHRKIVRWSEKTATGMIFDLDFLPRNDVWREVRVDTDLCLRGKCPFRADCFYYRARARWVKADVLIMNHHLFFADLASGGALLPPVAGIVFDEAHSLEEIATEFFGVRLTAFRVPQLLGRLLSPRTGKGLLPFIVRDSARLEEWRLAVDRIRAFHEEFFRLLREKFGGERKALRLRRAIDAPDHLSRALNELGGRLEKLARGLKREELARELEGYAGRAKQAAADLETLVGQKVPDAVYWYEEGASRRLLRQSLNLAPISPAELLRSYLWSKGGPAVLASATLTTAGDFDYFQNRLGLEGCRTLLLDSPFDYRRRALIFADRNLPDPTREREAYEERAIVEIERIVKAVRGGAFVLFTSYRMLDAAYRRLSGRLGDLPVLRQGDADRYRLLEDFRGAADAVLFGTSSFWQGVDVPGESLKCVIIVKLPFGVPDEPVIEARLDAIRAAGGEPFREYQLPAAVIMLRQGFGRLIRSRSDYGVVAILDPRVLTRNYGRLFFSSLPPAPVTDEIGRVKTFLKAFVPRPAR